jgi:tetratricopeptide (TPR) repeat protein
MDTDLAQKAIAEALHGKWKEAISLNKQVLEDNPKDIDALNRLARAHFEVGEIKKARATAEKVLKLDPFNTIAAKALVKWKGIKKTTSPTSDIVSSSSFLEEPGKTKIVTLLCLGDKELIGKLYSGDEVKLAPHGHRVSVVTLEGKYVGRLPDDLSARLKNMIGLGNKYQTFIKSIETDFIKVFIRETFRCDKLADTPSFTPEKIDYVSFTLPDLIYNNKEETPEPETSEESF